jgi:histidinol-phosphate aminotransferase
MTTIEQLVRNNIRQLKPYSSARSEFEGGNGILLDANESPYGTYNRYPDPQQKKLKEAIAKIKQVSVEQVFLGNGSDEAIDIAVRVFCEPRQHQVLSFPPTFGVISVAAAINDVALVNVPLNTSFQLDMDAIMPLLKDESIRLAYLCSPNNPTGNLLQQKDIEYILENFNGIVVVDEAYTEFSNTASFTRLIGKYERLVVLQTFSKAWALAGARVGMAYAHPETIRYFNKVKMPYNISQFSQQLLLEQLQQPESCTQRVQEILKEKEKLKEALLQSSLIKKLYPSDANFFLAEVADADSLYKQLTGEGVIVRNQHRAVTNCLRITVGTAAENELLIAALKKLAHE